MEALGNKALLEKKINIRASDYRFADKKKYYEGFVNSRGQQKEGTINEELLHLAHTMVDFKEPDIEQRSLDIQNGFLDFLMRNNLLK